MRDEEIVALYWQRNEDAIRETEQRYGRYLFKIAYQVLADPEDSEESVNDTYLKAWSAMPPHRPGVLSTFLGRLTRQLSIDRRRARNREKRRPSEYALSLSELEECVSGGDLTRETVDFHLLAEAINAYLLPLSPEARGTFVGMTMDNTREDMTQAVLEGVAFAIRDSFEVAKALGIPIHRTRLGLRRHLEQEGFL